MKATTKCYCKSKFSRFYGSRYSRKLDAREKLVFYSMCRIPAVRYRSLYEHA